MNNYYFYIIGFTISISFIFASGIEKGYFSCVNLVCGIIDGIFIEYYISKLMNQGKDKNENN